MEWLRAHPYLDAAVITGSLLIVGALIVRTQLGAPIATTPTEGTWGSAHSIYTEGVSTGGATLLPDVQTGPTIRAESLGYIPLLTENTIGTGPVDESSTFDFGSLVALLSRPSQPTATPRTESETGIAYSFIPGGLIATTTLAKPRTTLQDALYLFGNEVGDAIVSFEASHPNQPAILKHHIEQPNDPEARAALKKLGDDLTRLGDTIGALGEVPEQVAGTHRGVVAAYRDIGTKLAAISTKEGSDALFDAIVTYNAAAEDFAKKFVSLALIFQSYGVTFSPGDGGSVFVFPSGGL